ncbi:AAA family ATPase [Plastoroseomonas hellenica]|uniref:Pilus assembly protein n=1 Tax=Plastoroseomonas hellenica TaxID=2687306 RepID=A0ABS5EVG1_9PROT|nr:pilus assembly protein [Plastoroseomonas hellenica]MBR0642112.1 pilus assembly protein [Plastoroseomonas hellenica]MBR0664239.1 pilus assembly protein [Plastoroseomonas hellenica]
MPPPSEAAAAPSLTRTDRKRIVCFTTDPATEAALRDGFSDPAQEPPDVRRGDIVAAIAALRRMPTPHVLLVDVSGHAQPLAALDDLSHVVEPDVQVLVIGDRQDLGFYRHLTRGLGIADYLYKPISATMVAEAFAPLVSKRRTVEPMARGGRMIAITGARGGAGASTVAVNLAWYLANAAQRHTILLDADLHRGTGALLLGTQTGSGLRAALEFPDRVDELFIERSAQFVSERLHVLAGEESLEDQPGFTSGATQRLVGTLRRRYNYIVADVPFRNEAFSRELCDLAQQRVVVMEPQLAALRDALRLMRLPVGSGQVHRPLLVLNRGRRKGVLSIKQVSETLGQPPDVIIPEGASRLESAETMGEPAVAKSGAFRAAITQLAHACGAVSAAPKRRGLFGLFRK